MTEILISDPLRKSIEAATDGKCTVLYTSKGYPTYMTIIPAFNCEEQGFGEVVKIAKSLDREAIEKWPDERLFLIGAERKPKEEYSYDLKKEPAK